MLRLNLSQPVESSRRWAVRALFIRYGIERTPEGRSLRLLRQWLLPLQRAQFAKRGYFEVVGGDTGKRYRIYAAPRRTSARWMKTAVRRSGYVPAERQSADRGRNAVPKDRAGELREPRAPSG